MAKRGESYRVAGAVLLNGISYPFTDFAVDINAYSIASSISATLPLRAPAPRGRVGPLVDFGDLMQKTLPMPIAVRLGYLASPSPQQPVPTINLEQGYVDTSQTKYGTQQITIQGRGTASIFQDIQVGDPVNRNIRGDQLVSSFFSKVRPGFPKGIPLVVGAESPVFTGKTHDDALYTATMRNRTEWDEMAAAALDDGFVLSCHNGVGYYGPPALNAPVLPMVWGGKPGNVVDCDVAHSPRRNHQIAVRVFSYRKKKGKSQGRTVVGSYGHASPSYGATYDFFVSGLTYDQAVKKAQAIFLDLSRREFLLELEIVPDVAFIQTVSQYGANFSIALSGRNVMPSHKRTYGVRQVRFNMTNGTKLGVSIVASNLNPVNEGAALAA